MLSAETKELICDHFAGGCTGILNGDFFHWHTGEFLATEDEVAEVLDAAEIFECPVCGWWSHPSESYLDHGEDCECDTGTCGECCPRHDA